MGTSYWAAARNWTASGRRRCRGLRRGDYLSSHRGRRGDCRWPQCQRDWIGERSQVHPGPVPAGSQKIRNEADLELIAVRVEQGSAGITFEGGLVSRRHCESGIQRRFRDGLAVNASTGTEQLRGWCGIWDLCSGERTGHDRIAQTDGREECIPLQCQARRP